MIVVENASRDPVYNQAFEEYVFEHADADALILWRSASAVVCGCYQNVYAEVDLLRAQEMGAAVVRRISGGGAVYHDEGNVNYSFICPRGGEGVDYARFVGPVAAALRAMGADVSVRSTGDIDAGRLKVSGSAQKLARGRTLHHGTLLYDADLSVLRSLTRGRRGKFSSRGIQSAPRPVTNLRAVMPCGAPDTDEFEERLKRALAPNAPVVRLTEAENESVRRLAQDKYASWEWTCAASPAFECRTNFLMGDSPVYLSYKAKKGVIEDVLFAPDSAALRRARGRLMGMRLDIGEARGQLDDLPDAEALCRALF